MKYRPHRGSLDQAMQECVDLAGNMDALRGHLLSDARWFDPDSIKVRLYSGLADERIGWDETYIVTVTWADGTVAPVGWTNEMPKGHSK